MQALHGPASAVTMPRRRMVGVLVAAAWPGRWRLPPLFCRPHRTLRRIAALFWLQASEGSLGAQPLREMMIDRLMPDADARPGMTRVRRTTRDGFAVVEEARGRSPRSPGSG